MYKRILITSAAIAGLASAAAADINEDHYIFGSGVGAMDEAQITFAADTGQGVLDLNIIDTTLATNAFTCDDAACTCAGCAGGVEETTAGLSYDVNDGAAVVDYMINNGILSATVINEVGPEGDMLEVDTIVSLDENVYPGHLDGTDGWITAYTGAADFPGYEENGDLTVVSVEPEAEAPLNFDIFANLAVPTTDLSPGSAEADFFITAANAAVVPQWPIQVGASQDATFIAFS